VCDCDDLIRTDRAGSLAAPKNARIYEGVAARVHRPGDGLPYPATAKAPARVEFRDRAELARVVDQLPGKVFTLLHPDDLVSAGAPAHVIGHVVYAKLVGDEAVVGVAISDPAGEAAIDAGLHELSMGYRRKLDAEGYQRNTIVDHLALVPRARCGAQCSLQTDCADDTATVPGAATCACKIRAVDQGSNAASMSDQSTQTNEDKTLTAAARPVPSAQESEMSQDQQTEVVVGDAPVVPVVATPVAPAVVATPAPADKSLDALNEQLAAANARANKAELDAANAQADLKVVKDALEAEKAKTAAEKVRADKAEADAKAAGEKANKDAADALDARADARAELFATAAAFVKDAEGKPVSFKGKADREIKLAVVTALDGADHAKKAIGKDDSFVDGLFTSALDRHAEAAASRAGVRTSIVESRRDGAQAPSTGAAAEAASHAAMRRSQANAWKKSPTATR